MTITVFEWIAESTQLNEKKKENFSRSFFASNVFEQKSCFAANMFEQKSFFASKMFEQNCCIAPY